MRCVTLIATVIGAAIGLAAPINADGSDKQRRIDTAEEAVARG